MVLAGLIMDVTFTAAGLVPEPNPNIRAELTSFSFNSDNRSHLSGKLMVNPKKNVKMSHGPRPYRQ